MATAKSPGPEAVPISVTTALSRILAVMEEHRFAKRGRDAGRGGPPDSVRVDHVAIAGHDAALAFRLFEGLGRNRYECEAVLACAGADRPAGGDAEERDCLERAGRRRGALLVRAGSGPVHQLYAGWLAAPGRIALGSDSRLCACGGLGALALPATPLEIAAVLAGAPMSAPSGEVVPVRLLGKPPGWMSGEDVALELRRRMVAVPPRGSLLEFEIAEPDSLPVPARMAIAREVPGLGAVTALFPSDEVVRTFLKAQGRESDWRPHPGNTGAATGRGMDVDFSDVEPLIGRSSGEILALRELVGTPVRSIWIGPEADHAELARLAAILARGVRVGVEVTVTIGRRSVHTAATRAGTIAALRAAGAALRFGTDAGPPIARPGGGLALACAGAPAALVVGRRSDWQWVGRDSCAAAALAGAVADPRGLAAPEVGEVAAEVWLPGKPPVAHPAGDGVPGGGPAPEPAPAPGMPIVGPMRGTVLVRLGDRVTVDQVLPWGPRVRMSPLRVEDLARFAFAGLDPGFAARAALHGGGWVVAGRDFGAGEWRDQVGMVAARLGLRAVLARSYDPVFRRRLLQHGILALRFVAGGDHDDVRAGDELELPDLPEGLESGKPLVVRNLTRGTPYALHHDLDEGAIEQVRSGGLLAWAAHRGGR